MAVSMRDLVAGLSAETGVLTAMLAPLPADAWDLPTPAPGWTIRDQVTHLAYFDEAATLAVTSPDRFLAEAGSLAGHGAGAGDEIARRYRELPPGEALDWFRRARAGLARVFADLDPRARLPWYGPSMSAASSVTARLMETWAHGQDVADTLGAHREPTGRLRHVAHLGVATFGFAFAAHGRPVPEQPVRVALTAPDGGTWAWGPDGVPDVVRGPALDFCLVVTQRRHLADTALVVAGPVASAWMEIAQAFAGPPGPGRAPGAR
jgi:uncharacterized protein (TIGR03084 family)